LGYICQYLLIFHIIYVDNHHFVAEDKEGLLEKLDELEKTLNHAEANIITKYDLTKPIAKSLNTSDKIEGLICLIPKSVLTHHYVEFRMTLRR